MIIMGDKKRKEGALAFIMDKLHGKSKDHESMKEENAEMMEKTQMAKESDGELEQKASKIMQALESGNVASFKEALKSFIEMIS